jgi:outer membrane protein TolC
VGGAGEVQQAALLTPAVSEANDTLPAPTPLPPGMTLHQPSHAPFPVTGELSAEALVQAVLARSPTLAQMVAAQEAAATRYPQVTALDDPMLSGWMAPATIDARPLNYAQRVELTQKVPYPGKLRLRGENALAEARAAGNEVEDTRLQLIEAARDAFYDYYLVGRALAVNAENLELLRKFRRNAETRYTHGQVTQQDVLQADVEVGRQQERQLSLERMLQVAVARINTLMHLSPDSPLPPPPQAVPVEEILPDVAVLRTWALARRPDLRALANRVEADRAALALAYKEFYPDADFMAAYDSFWQGKDDERSLRPQIGLRLNLPVRLERRRAAVAEARARLAQRQAALARQTDQVNFEVQQAYEQVRESDKAVRLYDRTILPTAEGNVKAAEPAYVNGKIPFLSLIEAERNLVGLRDRYYEVVADYFRRRAALERVVGGPLVPTPPRAGGPDCLRCRP